MFIPNDSGQDKGRQRNNLQTQLIIAEDDLKKAQNLKEMADADLRKKDKERDRLVVEINTKREELAKMEFNLTQLEAKVKELKKKINLI